MPRPKPSKDETYWKVLSAAIELDFQFGHERWTLTQLSRATGVSRTLIYYYFGKSRSGILLEAARLIGEELAGFTPEKALAWQEGRVWDALILSRRLLEKLPAMLPLYYAHRNKDTPLGREVRKIEAEHLAKIARFFPQASEDARRAIFALLLGLSFSPDIPDAAVRAGTEIVLRGCGLKGP